MKQNKFSIAISALICALIVIVMNFIFLVILAEITGIKNSSETGLGNALGVVALIIVEIVVGIVTVIMDVSLIPTLIMFLVELKKTKTIRKRFFITFSTIFIILDITLGFVCVLESSQTSILIPSLVFIAITLPLIILNFIEMGKLRKLENN